MTATGRPLIRLVIGSTRPVRVGDQLAAHVAPALHRATGMPVETIDLAAVGLPMLDEPEMAATGRYARAHTREWSRTIADSDAVVFLTPQYNAGYPASVKNAVDYLFREWHDKPGAIVSYGRHGGGRSAAQLREVLAFVRMSLTADHAEIMLDAADYGADGRLTDPAAAVARAEASLVAVGQELRALVQARPEAGV